MSANLDSRNVESINLRISAVTLGTVCSVGGAFNDSFWFFVIGTAILMFSLVMGWRSETEKKPKKVTEENAWDGMDEDDSEDGRLDDDEDVPEPGRSTPNLGREDTV